MAYQRAENFRAAVALMRVSQKAYFRTRSRSELDRSKHYEKVVDDWLKRHAEEDRAREPMVQQALLLGGDLAWQLHAGGDEPAEGV